MRTPGPIWCVDTPPLLIDAELLRMAFGIMNDTQRAEFVAAVDAAYYYEGHDHDENPVSTLNKILS